MSDFHPFTEDQWDSLGDCNCDMPVPLEQADLSKPFVYDRKFGVFYVPGGFHPAAMATLLAFHHGLARPRDVAYKLGLTPGFIDCGEYWLKHTPGAAYRSSVGKRVIAGTPQNLNAVEQKAFGEIFYVMD